MNEAYQSLSHSRWDCKYHVVFVLKRRRKTLFGTIRQKLGGVFHELARQKECRIVQGHLSSSHRLCRGCLSSTSWETVFMRTYDSRLAETSSAARCAPG